MPITKQARKKMRRDRKTTVQNAKSKTKLRKAVKDARLDSNKENLKKAFSMLDKAAKTNLIHKNKASRLKSRLSSKKTSK